MNSDCQVEWADFGIFSTFWQQGDESSVYGDELSADLNRDNFVEWADFGIFSADWQWSASWYPGRSLSMSRSSP